MALIRTSLHSPETTFIGEDKYMLIVASTCAIRDYVGPITNVSEIASLGGTYILNAKNKSTLNVTTDVSGGAYCSKVKDGIATRITSSESNLDADFVVIEIYGASSTLSIALT